MVPNGHDADAFRSVVLERFNMSLGAALGRFKTTGLTSLTPFLL